MIPMKGTFPLMTSFRTVCSGLRKDYKLSKKVDLNINIAATCIKMNH